MVDLTLKNLTAPVQDPSIFIPPSSGAYRNYLYPGFFSGGNPSTTPNPVLGNDPVAAPAAGEFGFTPPPEPAAATTGGLSGITSIDSSGSTLGERQANRLAEVRGAGEVTDPWDFARSVNLGLQLTGPIGIAGLAAGEGLIQAGVDPFGIGSAFDLKSNINKRPGYTEAFDDAIRGGASPQGALDAARSATDPGSNTWGAKGFGTQPRDPSGTAPAPSGPTDVTSLNARTGFGGQGGANVGGTGNAAPAPASKPGTVAAPAAPTGRPSGYVRGGGAGASGSSGRGGNVSDGRSVGGDRSHGGGGRRAMAKGGVVTMKPEHRSAARENHALMRQVAERTGMSVPQLIMRHESGSGPLAARARLAGHVMRLACGGVAKKYAGGGVATDDMQYDPPAELTEGEGDIVDAKLTPGEMVLTKPAAQQYDPRVLAALNDPEMAAEINAMIEQFLADEEPEDGMEDADMPEMSDDEVDDQGGLGVFGRDRMAKPSVLGSIRRAA